MDLLKLGALELGQKIKDKEISVHDATSAMLDKIQADGNIYNAYISVFKDEALKSADEIQAKIDSGELTSPLAGVPMAIKDNICTKDMLSLIHI